MKPSANRRRVIDLAARLHFARCQSARWSQDCRRPDGGRHARETWYPIVRSALASVDPAAAVHDLICDADLDPNHGCPAREQHIALLATELGLSRGRSCPGATTAE